MSNGFFVTSKNYLLRNRLSQYQYFVIEYFYNAAINDVALFFAIGFYYQVAYPQRAYEWCVGVQNLKLAFDSWECYRSSFASKYFFIGCNYF
jgi:hypothetical protein